MKDMYKFEKNLKKKLDEAEFPFDEQNWEKASAMIDASRDNRKPFFFYFLSGLALLITTGLVYYFVASDNNTPENQLAVKENTVRTIETAPEVNFNATVVSDASTETTNSASDLNSNATENSNNTTSTASEKAVVAASKKSVGKTALVKKTNLTSAQTANSNALANTTAPSTASDPANSSASSKANTPANAINEIASAKKSDKIKSTTVKEIPVVLGSQSSAQPAKAIASTPPTQVNGNTNKLGTPVTTDSIAVAIKPSEANKTQPAVAQSRVTDSIADVRTQTAATLIVNSTDSVAKTPITTAEKAATDSASAITAMSIAAPFQVKQTKNFIYAEVGGSYLFGWNSNEVKEAKGFNIVVGLNYLHYFNEHISLGAGVQYNTLNNLTNSSYTASTVNYDFGVKKDITTIKYLQLHYITVPVKLGFNAGKNNVFGIGANVSTLLNSDCRTDKYRTNNTEPMTENNRLSTKKETGYLTSFNAYDVQASAFYRRRLVKGLSVNAEFFYGLTDIKKNDHFKNNNFERAMGAKLTLCYDLFKK